MKTTLDIYNAITSSGAREQLEENTKSFKAIVRYAKKGMKLDLDLDQAETLYHAFDAYKINLEARVDQSKNKRYNDFLEILLSQFKVPAL